jgi:putative protease
MASKKKPARNKVIKRKPLKKKAPKRKPIKKKAGGELARKKTVKRGVSKKKTPKKRPTQKSGIAEAGNLIGTVTHYFPQVQAAVIKLKAPLSVGDTIKVKGHTTDFKETVNSIQIDRVPITSAKKGQEIGLLVNSRVRQHDKVYKL